MNIRSVVLITLLINTSAICAQIWEKDFEIAKKIAYKENKPIILVFQGSDWCAPCIKLDREVWSTEIFKKYAKEHYVMVKVDFPKRKRNALSPTQAIANAKLAEKYNQNGIFPLVVILDAGGRVLGETGYKKTTPEDYIIELKAIAN